MDFGYKKNLKVPQQKKKTTILELVISLFQISVTGGQLKREVFSGWMKSYQATKGV
jgi:hypothetical protein